VASLTNCLQRLGIRWLGITLLWLLVIFAAYALIGGTVSAPPPFKAENSTATGG
jgi:hypothetical protein